jgi:hypothetical protein
LNKNLLNAKNDEWFFFIKEENKKIGNHKECNLGEHPQDIEDNIYFFHKRLQKSRKGRFFEIEPEFPETDLMQTIGFQQALARMKEAFMDMKRKEIKSRVDRYESRLLEKAQKEWDNRMNKKETAKE